MNIYFFSNNKFENWICAFSNHPNFIFIFSPKAIEKLTIHKKDDIESIILHELSHIFYSRMINYPNRIINEGIAVYLKLNFLSKNEAEKIKLENFDLFDNNKNPYTEGFSLICALIEKLGKEKFFDFLNEIKQLGPSEANSKILNILK
jgi:hypothetical protein